MNVRPKTHVLADPGLRLAPGRRRWLLVFIVICVVLASLWARTGRSEAAGNTPDLCWAWKTTCVAYRYFLGVRYCVAWQTTCVGAPTSQRHVGLASPRRGSGSGCHSYWTNVACTVVRAGRGWAFGDCAAGLAFSGLTGGTLFQPGAPVSVSGCENEHKVLLAAGRKFPLASVGANRHLPAAARRRAPALSIGQRITGSMPSRDGW